MIYNIYESVLSIINYSWLKLTGAFSLATLGFFFDLGQEDLLISLLALIIIDSITAVYANFKKGNPIESRKMAKTAGKIAIYFIVVSAGFMAENMLPFLDDGVKIIDELILGYFVITELISILENSKRAGVPIPDKVYNLLKEYKEQYNG